MAYSRINYVGNGSTTQFSINFPLGFITRANVTCHVVGEVDGLGNQLYRTLTWINDGLVSISGAAPGSGTTVVFERTVDKEELVHDYSDGASIVEENLDQSNKQNIMLVHEVLDGRFGVLQNDIDMGQHSVHNLVDPVDDQDAVNLQFFMANNAAENKIAAEEAASAAQASAIDSSVSATTALSAATAAEDSADDAATSAAAAALFSSVYTKSYIAGVDFTAGSTNDLVMDHPVAKAVLIVTFDGITQHHSQYNTTGAVLEFTSVIPVGVNEVEITYGVRAGSIDWSNVADTPTTLSGYGITDAATSESLTTHTGNTSNPHGTTAAQVGAYTTAQVDTLLAAKLAHTGGTATNTALSGTTTIPGSGSISSGGDLSIYSGQTYGVSIIGGASGGQVSSTGNMVWGVGSSGWHLFRTNGVEYGRMDAGTWSFGGAAGAESLRVVPVTSAVNYLEATGGATGVGTSLVSRGSDANVNAAFATKGGGQHVFYTNFSVPQLVVSHTANAVNYLQTTGSTTGSAPILRTAGSDTNINVSLITKGTGAYYFQTGNAGNNQLVVSHTASAVNYLNVTGASTTGAAAISAAGSDANVAVNIAAKGLGALNLMSGGSVIVHSQPSSANDVNYFVLQGAASGGAPSLSVSGSDANIALNLFSKGTGSINLTGGGGTMCSFLNAASVANVLQFSPAAAASAPYIATAGSDANIDLALVTKGAGVVKFTTAGNFAANGSVATVMTGLGPAGSHTTIQEWLVIKNASGTVRYIPCY